MQEDSSKTFSPLLDPSLIVSEIFGPTLQGEGPSLGKPAIFVRLGTCNLHCVWCDTAYTWDASRFDLSKELKRMTGKEILKEVDDIACRMWDPLRPIIVISGGEPMIQSLKLGPLLKYWSANGWSVEIETNGTFSPMGWEYSPHYNVSPKLSGSENQDKAPLDTDILREYVQRPAVFKFVVSEPSELNEVDGIILGAQIPRSRVYIMPQGIDIQTLSRTGAAIADGVIQRGYNMTTRLHVQLWGNTRAR